MALKRCLLCCVFYFTIEETAIENYSLVVRFSLMVFYGYFKYCVVFDSVAGPCLGHFIFNSEPKNHAFTREKDAAAGSPSCCVPYPTRQEPHSFS